MRFSALAALLLLLTGTMPQAAPQPGAEPFILHILDPQTKPSSDELHTVALLCGTCTAQTPLSEYLTCVVLSELYPDFSDETFKAQAVAARTAAVHTAQKRKHADGDVCTDAACCQAYFTREELRQKLGGKFEDAWQRAAAAVAATDGEMLYYGDALCECTYFAASGGRTESAAAVWGGEVPYLISVDSPNEARAAVTVRVSAEDGAKKLRAVHPDADLHGTVDTWFSEPSRTDGGGVRTQTVGGVSFTGSELKRIFALAATDFTVTTEGETLIFTVRGSGHRVGMSQYGAEAMAQSGADYRTILAHYYPGTTIQ